MDGPWGGNLVAFVDYASIPNGDFAIIKVQDLYFQYNLADKYNKGVAEKPNQVTAVKSGDSAEAVSEMLVGLDMQNSTFVYTLQNTNTVIELCSEGTNANGARFVRMSIHEEPSQTSRCLAESSVP